MATNITANVELNIRELMLYLGVENFSDFGRVLGVSKHTIANWKKRNTYDIVKIENAIPNINRLWLLTGEGEMLKPTVIQQVEGSSGMATQIAGDEVTVIPLDDYAEVAFFDLSATAGLPSGDPQTSGTAETRLVPKQYAGEGNYVVRISGDSMDDGTSRSICHGDEVIVQREIFDSVNGLPIRSKLFIVDTLDGAVLKQITEINRTEGYVSVHSFNTLYKDYNIPLSEIRGFYAVKCFSHKPIRF